MASMCDLYPPPQFRPVPAGEAVDFAKLCARAGMKIVVSGAMPDVRLHGEAVDFKAVSPGLVSYCLGVPLLPSERGARARTILSKLAYQFMDYASREIVAAAHRAHRREAGLRVQTLRRALAPNASRLLLRLCEVKVESVSMLADSLGIAQPHVSRAVQTLVAAGLVQKRRVGRQVFVELAREIPLSLTAFEPCLK